MSKRELAIDLVVEEPARFVLSRTEKWSDGTNIGDSDIKDPELLLAAHAVAAKKTKEFQTKLKNSERSKAYRKNNPEIVAACNLSWEKDNSLKRLEINRRRRANDPEKARKYTRDSNRKHRYADLEKARIKEREKAQSIRSQVPRG